MNRTLLSKRISSLLAEVSRLSNALCAMSTMDLQRYPENYELLSTDAALRAEQIACRMRHLVYGFTTVQKHEYLTSAFAADEASGEADVVDVQADQFADPDTGRIQNLKHGLIPAALHFRNLGLL